MELAELMASADGSFGGLMSLNADIMAISLNLCEGSGGGDGW